KSGALGPRLCPPFCNGPRLVNPLFCVVAFAEYSLLSGVGARPPPDGVRRGSADQSTRACSEATLGGQGSDLSVVPARGLRFGKAGVVARPRTLIAPFLGRRGGRIEWCPVDQHSMHDHGQLAGERDLRLVHADALGEPCGPAFEA